MTFDQMLADRITGLALDDPGVKTDDVGAAWLDGYARALGDLDHGALPGVALQLARDMGCLRIRNFTYASIRESLGGVC